jgi:hypothetical protein
MHNGRVVLRPANNVSRSAHTASAVALAGGDWANAIRELHRSLARNPYHRETLAAFSRDAGARGDALRYADPLAELKRTIRIVGSF